MGDSLPLALLVNQMMLVLEIYLICCFDMNLLNSDLRLYNNFSDSSCISYSKCRFENSCINIGRYKTIVTKHAKLGSDFHHSQKTSHSKIRLKDGFAPKMAWQEKKSWAWISPIYNPILGKIVWVLLPFWQEKNSSNLKQYTRYTILGSRSVSNDPNSKVSLSSRTL